MMFITGGVALSLELIVILLSVALISFAKTHKNMDTSPAKATGWVVFIMSLTLLICTSFFIVIAAQKGGKMMMMKCPCSQKHEPCSVAPEVQNGVQAVQEQVIQEQAVLEIENTTPAQ